MKAERTLVQTHPALIKFLGARSPLKAWVCALPLLVGFAYISLTQPSLWQPLYMLLGCLYWSWLEYAIHRFVYHVKLKPGKAKDILDTFHLYHHRNLADARVLNAGPLLIYPTALVILLPFLPIYLHDAGSFSAFALATLLSYLAYEYVHYAIHLKPHHKGYMAFIQRYHMYHHEKNWHKNYGNTSTLWDRLLGTYDAGYKDYQMSDTVKASLVHNQQKNS